MYEIPNANEFIRLGKAIVAGRGNRAEVIRAAETQRASDRVMTVLKAPTAAASLADPEFAGTLASYSQISRAFVDSIRDRSLFYRIADSAIPAPLFDRSVAVAMIADDPGERGEGEWLPVLRFSLSDDPLRPVETGAIVVVTSELAKATDRDSFAALRLELERAAIASVDRRFWALASDGVAPVAATRDPLADLRAMLDRVVTSGMVAPQWAISAGTAARLATLAGAGGSPLFPDLGPLGGTLLGLPVAVSDAIPAGNVALIDALSFAAHVGTVAIDQAEGAALRMRTDPAAGAELVSLWQSNLVALRVVARFGAARRRDEGVAISTGWTA